MNFGFAIKYMRKKNTEYTQADLAKVIGVDRSYIGGLETNKRTPSLNTLIKIADNLNVTLRTLINLSVLDELYEKYTIPTGNSSQRIISNDKIEAINTYEAYAFRDLYPSLHKTNFHNHIGAFLDDLELRTKQYESNEVLPIINTKEKIPVNSSSLSEIIDKGIEQDNIVLFRNNELTDAQLLGLNHYLEAITNQKNGGV
jgi:transcriptional regulator with XRE-family HTH domain